MLSDNFIDYFSSEKRRILFFGASVTAQKEGWRAVFSSRLDRISKISHEYKTIALGGSGSILGLSLIAEDLKNNDYDVVFFEYLTGDYSGFTSLEVTEKILVEIFQLFTRKNIVVFSLHFWRLATDLEPKSLYKELYLKIAREIGINLINVDNFISKGSFIASHQLKYFRDDCHTNRMGAFLLTELIFSHLNKLPNFSFGNNLGILSEYSNSKIYPAAELCNSKSVFKSYEYPSTGQTFNFIELLEGDSLDFNFIGIFHGVFVIAGPESGNLEISFNDQLVEVKIFDSLCYYERPGLWGVNFKSDFLTNVSIRLSPNPVDFSLSRESNALFENPRKIKIIGVQASGSKLLLEKKNGH